MAHTEEEQQTPIAYIFNPEKVVRYDQHIATNDMYEAADGEWVSISDYEKLLALYKQTLKD